MGKSGEYWKGIKQETNYGGGVAGALYAKTEPANTAALDSAPYPFIEEQVYPSVEYEQIAMEAGGQRSTQKQTFTTDKKIKPGKMAQVVQGNTWRNYFLSSNGHEDFNFGANSKTESTTTGLTANTAYYFKVNIDGGGVLEYTFTTPAVDETYAALIAVLNSNGLLAVAAPQNKPNIQFEIVQSGAVETLRCISLTTGSSSSIAITAGTTGNDMLAALTDYDSQTTAVDGIGNADSDIPNRSWCEVFYNTAAVKAAYGCFALDYLIEIPKPPELPKETINYPAYDVATVGTPANFAVAKPWSTTTPKKHSDFDLYIDHVKLNDYDSIKLTLTKTKVDKQAGEELQKFPYLPTMNWEIEATTYDKPACLDDLESSAADLFPVSIAGWGDRITFTQMKVRPDSINVNTVPGEKGKKAYTFTLEIGGTSTNTVA